ncbi:MAG: dTDP-glucose 4,6-dehydratase [Saprospiraceae bacterium]|nr:dTDP-glucose 4,6-dehydratase [Saprospiraceae bacterium]
MDFKKIILVTGGAGFIGSHVVRRFVNKYPHYLVVNLDALTYAGNLDNLSDIENKSNYVFEKGDITDAEFINALFNKYLFTGVIHLAAESHVDRSISDPMAFITTNIIGTVNLLNAARTIWKNVDNTEGCRFHHVSTDEVFGSLGDEGFFTETTPYDPRSPYSASKASSDHLVSAYHHTYHLPTVLSNCSNNYGPNHFPEKLIPLIINNILTNKPLPIYGDGKYTRDWLWVKDHASAIDTIFHNGRVGESYNIGGNNEWKNIDLVHKLCDIMDEKLARPVGTARQLITFVKDRPGHDRRYAIDASKLKDELGWTPSISFDEGFKETIDWYLTNKEWVERVTSGAYQAYYTEQYA